MFHQAYPLPEEKCWPVICFILVDGRRLFGVGDPQQYFHLLHLSINVVCNNVHSRINARSIRKRVLRITIKAHLWLSPAFFSLRLVSLRREILQSWLFPLAAYYRRPLLPLQGSSSTLPAFPSSSLFPWSFSWLPETL